MDGLINPELFNLQNIASGDGAGFAKDLFGLVQQGQSLGGGIAGLAQQVAGPAGTTFANMLPEGSVNLQRMGGLGAADMAKQFLDTVDTAVKKGERSKVAYAAGLMDDPAQVMIHVAEGQMYMGLANELRKGILDGIQTLMQQQG